MAFPYQESSKQYLSNRICYLGQCANVRMSRSISESDWNIFRRLHPIALERFCKRVLGEIVSLASSAKTPQQRYVEIYKVIRDRNKELAQAFDDLRRSTAILQLAIFQASGLLSEGELNQFSEATKSAIMGFRRIAGRDGGSD